jgi:hypothetical protein
MTKIKITCEFDFDFDEKASEVYKWQVVQGVMEQVYSRQLSHTMMMLNESNDEQKKILKDSLILDSKIAKEISENAKVEIITDMYYGSN